MPDDDKSFGGSLVLDFGKWWRHVKTIYSRVLNFLNQQITEEWIRHSSYKTEKKEKDTNFFPVAFI